MSKKAHVDGSTTGVSYGLGFIDAVVYDINRVPNF